MIHKIINWDKQEVAKGKKTVRTACLKGKLKFKFFSSPESNQIYIVHWNFSNCLLNFFTIHYLFKYRNQSLFHPDLMYIVHVHEAQKILCQTQLSLTSIKGAVTLHLSHFLVYSLLPRVKNKSFEGYIAVCNTNATFTEQWGEFPTSETQGRMGMRFRWSDFRERHVRPRWGVES